MKAESPGGRIDTFRTLRAQAEASILPLATSLDGRHFSFQARIDGLDLRLGGYVMLEGDGRAALGQVRSLGVAEADIGELGLPGDDDTDVRTRLRIRLARGDGVILARDTEPFHDHLARAATAEEVRAWQAEVAPERASLAVGSLSLAGGAPINLDAGGFDRRTFLCGQSGSVRVRARPGARAAAARDGPAHRHPRPDSDCARLGELR